MTQTGCIDRSNEMQLDPVRPKSEVDVGSVSDHSVLCSDLHVAGKRKLRDRKLKVVVADDERLIADTLTLIFAKSGFEARAVYSGEHAIQVLESFMPDVLITDVVMNGLNGLETGIAVTTMSPGCKILLFSGSEASADLLEQARTLGNRLRFSLNQFTRATDSQCFEPPLFTDTERTKFPMSASPDPYSFIVESH